jgi:hypothetical protein
MRVGRTLTYCPSSQVLLLIGDGTSENGPHSDSSFLRKPRPLSHALPTLIAWNLAKGPNWPKLVYASKPVRSKTAPVPNVLGSGCIDVQRLWRSSRSPDGRFVTVREPEGGWHVLDATNPSLPDEIPLQRDSPDNHDGLHAHAEAQTVAAMSFSDSEKALIVWADGKVSSWACDPGSKARATLADTGLLLSDGACLINTAVRQNGVADASEQTEPDPSALPVAVLEPEWEDGSALELVGHRVGSKTLCAWHASAFAWRTKPLPGPCWCWT